MNSDNIMLLQLKNELSFTDRIVVLIFKNLTVKIYRRGLIDGANLNRCLS